VYPEQMWLRQLRFLVTCRGFVSGLRVNGHSRHRSGHGYESSSMLSSDVETTSFLESEDDASSRITTTTGRHTNMSIDRGTLGESFLSVSWRVLKVIRESPQLNAGNFLESGFFLFF